METRANYLMIGGFVLGVLAFAFIFVFWISNFAGGGNRYRIVFERSVAGLTSGSSVSFNGIKVGEVQTFALDPKDGRKVQVVISVDDKTPVREDSRARIHSQGLTGGTGIQITPGTPKSPLLVPTDKDPIPTIQAAVGGGGLFDAAPAALNSATAFIQRLDDLVAANEEAINSTMSNVDQFTTMLKDQNEKVSRDDQRTAGGRQGLQRNYEQARHQCRWADPAGEAGHAEFQCDHGRSASRGHHPQPDPREVRAESDGILAAWIEAAG